jgi:hypothetical protein
MFSKTIPRLQHIVLAYTDGMRSEHYFREGDEWRFEALVAPEDVLDMKMVDFQIELEQVYFDLHF